MNHYVIDCSVAVKWYIPEVHSEKSVLLLERLTAGEMVIHVPDLVFAETGNVLWKKIRKNELTVEEAHEIGKALLKIPKTVYPSAMLVLSALELASGLNRTVYDCLYLAYRRLAEWGQLCSGEGCQFRITTRERDFARGRWVRRHSVCVVGRQVVRRCPLLGYQRTQKTISENANIPVRI